MECLEGYTVEYLLDRWGALPVDRALAIIEDAIRGLAAGHSAGVLHRDVKPSNLFVTRTKTKVLDFGLALGIEDTRITEFGTILGTPCYLSPEAIRGQDPDPRADVYSLGCTLFHMVTGEPPYEAETMVETTVMHLEDPIPNPREIDPSIPPGLAVLLRRCLQKDPADRFVDARHLLETVQWIRKSTVADEGQDHTWVLPRV